MQAAAELKESRQAQGPCTMLWWYLDCLDTHACGRADLAWLRRFSHSDSNSLFRPEVAAGTNCHSK